MSMIPMGAKELQDTIKSGETVMAYFWSDWQPGCEETTPIIEKIGERYSDKAVVASINADDAGFLAIEINAYPLPMTILYQDGIEADRIVGAQELELYDYALKLLVDPPEVNPYELINSMGYM